MADFVYNAFKELMVNRSLLTGDMDESANTFQLALAMSNTTADTENDSVDFMDDFTTLDEMDGANYARKSLSNIVVTRDDDNDRTYFDADDVTWSALGNGTRGIVGAVLILLVNDDTDSIPVRWFDLSSTGTNPGGINFTVQFNSAGVLRLT